MHPRDGEVGNWGAFRNACLAFSPLPISILSVIRVLQLRARDPASRGDRYMLVTYDEPPYCIKVKGPARGCGGRDDGASRPGMGWAA